MLIFRLHCANVYGNYQGIHLSPIQFVRCTSNGMAKQAHTHTALARAVYSFIEDDDDNASVCKEWHRKPSRWIHTQGRQAKSINNSSFARKHDSNLFVYYSCLAHCVCVRGGIQSAEKTNIIYPPSAESVAVVVIAGVEAQTRARHVAIPCHEGIAQRINIVTSVFAFALFPYSFLSSSQCQSLG